MHGPADERPHVPADDPDWVEAWLFDAVQNDSSVAFSIELLMWPQRGQAAFHASVIRPNHALISLVELEARSPRPPSLEVRAPGLWTDVGIQTPLEHMTVDIEAFAVALDDPGDVFTGGFGVRTPIGSELEWETAAAIRPGNSQTAYEVPCIVHGELLLAEEVIDFDGWGWRSHRWGSPTLTDRTRVRGRSASGEWLLGEDLPAGLTMESTGEAPVPDPSVNAHLYQSIVRSPAGDMAWIRHLYSSWPDPDGYKSC